MKMMKSLGALVMLSLAIGAGSAFATPLIVVSANPAWVPVPGSDATYVLPENPICGETDPICEPVGVFNFNQPWTGPQQYFSFLDIDTGAVSDIITFDNLALGGFARVQFFSDPTFPPAGFLSSYSNTNVFLDTVGVTGPQSICCISGALLIVLMGSDRDGLQFRPFGVTFDASDAIQFQGAQNGSPVPEPASMTLLGAGLLVALRARRQLTKSTSVVAVAVSPAAASVRALSARSPARGAPRRR